MPREIARKPRFIYPTIATSLTLAKVSALAELLFWRILPQADDQGRLTGHPKQLKAQVCPMRDEITEENIPQLLAELEQSDLIIQYAGSSEPLLQIKKWWDFQSGMRRIYPSRYLPPEGWEDRVKGMKETSGGQMETNAVNVPEKQTNAVNVPPIVNISGNQVISKSVIPNKGFPALKEQLNQVKNKVGFLVDAFKTYHTHAPPGDFEDLGGRIAGILKSISYDYGYLLKLIWDSRSRDISGSHLNYIQGMIKGRNGVRLEDSGLYKEI